MTNMTLNKSILSAIANIKMRETIITDAELQYGTGVYEGETYLNIRVQTKAKQDDLCPYCHSHCSGYDSQGEERRWRALDCGGVQVYLIGKTRRVYCEHCKKTVTASVPWAFHKSRFSKAFDLTASYLALHINKSIASEYMRCSWRSIGNCISRTREYLEPDLSRRYNNLVNIGIDETSYKKGYKYLTVVVNHDTNEVVWVHENHGAEILKLFFEELSEEQRASIKTVSGDGARWIDSVIQEYIPQATRCMDAFHVVEWAMEALDEVRLECQRDAVKELANEQKKEEPSEKKINKCKEKVKAIKGAKYAVSKAPDNLTARQANKLELVAKTHKKVYRASILKEMLRLALKLTDPDEAKIALNEFFWKATHSRLEPFKKLAYKIRRHEKHILNTIETKISNARVEATNNKIKLIIRKGYGYRNIQNLKNIVLLSCSNLLIPLPNRRGNGLKAA